MADRQTMREPAVILVPASQEYPLRRGLSEKEAARYVGVGLTKFRALVADGRMPKPIEIDGRRIHDRHRLDRAMDALAPVDDDDANSWDDVR